MNQLSIIELGTFKNWGGKEQHIVELSEGLKNFGHDIVLVARNADAINTTVDKVSIPLRGAFDILSIFKLVNLIKQKKADIVHVHNGREAWIAVVSVILAGRGKTVLTRHAVLSQKNAFRYAWLYSKIAKVICVSNITKKFLLDNCSVINPKKVTVVYNGIDTNRVLAGNAGVIKEKHQISSEEKVVGFIGKYDSSKGTEVLIKAAASVVKIFPATKFLMVGKTQKGMDNYEQTLRHLITGLKLANKVILHGFAKDISDILAAIDILVMPSVTPEAFGLVLLEGMAAGKPVITTSNGGQAEILVNNETGLLIEPSNPEELTQAICQLIADPLKADQIGVAGRQAIAEKFSLNKMVAETVNVFKRCDSVC